MSEPLVPWGDEQEPDAGLRADLRAVRDQASGYDVERGLSRFERTLAATATAAAVASAANSAKAATAGAIKAAGTAQAVTTGGGMLGSALLKLAVVAVVGVTSTALWIAAPQPLADAPAATSVDPGVPPPAAAPATPEPAAPDEGVKPAEPAVVGVGDRASPPSPKAKPTREPQNLRLEMQQLERARALLARDPAQAYALLTRSSRRFVPGLFGEERAALAVVALWEMHERPRASRRARAFLRRYPDSSFALRVKEIAEAVEGKAEAQR